MQTPQREAPAKSQTFLLQGSQLQTQPSEAKIKPRSNDKKYRSVKVQTVWDLTHMNEGALVHHPSAERQSSWFLSVYVPTLTYGSEAWTMTKTKISWIQTVEGRFMRWQPRPYRQREEVSHRGRSHCSSPAEVLGAFEGGLLGTSLWRIFGYTPLGEGPRANPELFGRIVYSVWSRNTSSPPGGEHKLSWVVLMDMLPPCPQKGSRKWRKEVKCIVAEDLTGS